MILFTLLLIPIIVATTVWLFSKGKVSLGEFLIQNIVQLVILFLCLLCVGFGSTSDVEVWNGRVDNKYSERVSCSHAYPCRCRPVSCGKGCSTIHCDICFMHSYDVDWVVKTTNKEHIEIDRVNLQGTTEPSRWTNVKIGEPTSVAHDYTNYIKASPDSLFRKQGLVEKYKDKIPKYPGGIYDYYRLNRLVLVNGATVDDVAVWNKDLSEINADLGAKKKVNIITVVTKNLPSEYFYALEQAWIGSKQNDFVLVVNVDGSGKITWSNVMAFTQNKMAEIVVRNNVLKLDSLDRDKVLGVLREGVEQHFVKRHMKDFEYLKYSVTPTTGGWIFMMLFGFIVSIVLSYLFYNNNHDDDDEGIIIFKRGSKDMNTWAKIALGVVGVGVLLAGVGVSSVIGINNNMVQQEAGLTAQYKQNQNNYDNMVKKVVEVAQVPSMATSDLEKVTKAAISGRYGAEGSKAVFQFIQEQNPAISVELYSKVQVVIEAGRNSFEADQKVLLDKKRVYETSLNTFPSGLVARVLGFPRIDLAKIDIVTSDRTDKAFGSKKDDPIKLRE